MPRTARVRLIAIPVAGLATAFTVTDTGLSNGTVTPFLTNGSSRMAAQNSIPLGGGEFSATVPVRSLVTYPITH